MELLKEKFLRKLTETDLRIVRDFTNEVDWNNRLIGITGGRGCGKTTLILQYIKQHLADGDKVLYLSLDDIYFASHQLAELVRDFVLDGGQYLFLDEVHRYKNWSTEIKNLYDDYSGLRIVFTGSSMLNLRKSAADLSRRAVVYEMPGLSLREFILFDQGIRFPAFPLQQILSDHLSISRTINQRISPVGVFREYLQTGYYPYFLEGKAAFSRKLASTIDVVLESEIPSIIDLSMASVDKMRLLLAIISEGVPFTPNIQKISEKTGISRNTIIQYLHLLEDARIITLLYEATKGISRMQKPAKIYLHHPNHMVALTTSNTEAGNLRETFFMNQLLRKHRVSLPSSGDFLVDDQFLFEIGGRSKPKAQLKEHPRGYVASDDLEYGSGNRIPLWLFGFLD